MKKLLLTLGTTASVVAPLATVVACKDDVVPSYENSSVVDKIFINDFITKYDEYFNNYYELTTIDSHYETLEGDDEYFTLARAYGDVDPHFVGTSSSGNYPGSGYTHEYGSQQNIDIGIKEIWKLQKEYKTNVDEWVKIIKPLVSSKMTSIEALMNDGNGSGYVRAEWSDNALMMEDYYGYGDAESVTVVFPDSIDDFEKEDFFFNSFEPINGRPIVTYAFQKAMKEFLED